MKRISLLKGIEVEHVLASGTFPMFFDYPKFRVFNSKTTTTTTILLNLRSEMSLGL